MQHDEFMKSWAVTSAFIAHTLSHDEAQSTPKRRSQKRKAIGSDKLLKASTPTSEQPIEVHSIVTIAELFFRRTSTRA